MFDDLTGKIRRFFKINDDTKEIQWSRSKIYKRRVEQLKWGWIAVAILILIVGSVQFAIGAVLFTLFTSLSFLEPDEDEES